jgi:glycosyltransferase involved in cell wall biosynthesis
MTKTIDIVLPAHNEGGSIGHTLSEFHEIVSKQGYCVRFVVCEDGSTDNTVAVIQETAKTIPVKLISDSVRKGYSRAVVDGFKATDSDLIGFIDSDGQCNPADFDRLYREMQSSGVDLIAGYRNPRKDHWIRKLMSFAFGVVYRCFFNVRLKDPSCPFLIVKKEALAKLLTGNPGILRQGFWWEFQARAVAWGLKVREIPVDHRVRTAGQTQVYKPAKVPGIAWEHLNGLRTLKRELKQLTAK